MVFKQPAREIKSVVTAFELIQVLQDLGGATPNRLIDELDLSKSSIHNYLRTLEQMGYVVNENGTYRLGLRFLTHGIASKESIRVGRIIRSELDAVANELERPTWWLVEEHGRGIFLDVSQVETGSPVYGRIGKRSYLHTHALGKAVLAEASESYVTQVIEYQGLPAFTNETTADAETLFEELDAIRDDGYAVSHDGAVLGIRSVGVGFRDGRGGLHAIGVFGDSRELTDASSVMYAEELQETVESLESHFTTDGE